MIFKRIFSFFLSGFLLTGCGYTSGTGAGSCNWESSSSTILDDFEKSPGSNFDNYANAVTVAGSVLYASGMYVDATSQHWLVRKSTDSGVTWATVDDSQYAAGKNSQPYAALAVGSAIYVSGRGVSSSSDQRWLVRKSTDAGATWTNVDDYQLASLKTAEAKGITAVGETVYTVGSGEDSTGTPNAHWVVRKSENGGGVWSTVDNFEYAANADQENRATGAAVLGTQIFVTGNGGDTTGGANKHWLVRKSTDSGATWTTVDDFEYVVDKNNYPESIAAIGGNLYVVGSAMDNTGTSNDHWIVRKSSDQGTSWSTVDDFECSPGSNFSNIAFHVGGRGQRRLRYRQLRKHREL